MTQRIHITLNESSVRDLDKLADQYHNGNRSACVRSAINAYRLSNEEGEFKSITHVRTEIEKVREEIAELQEQLTNQSPNHAAQQTVQPPEQTTAQQNGKTRDSALKKEIYDYLHEHKGSPVPIEEISDHIEADLLHTRETAEKLEQEFDFVESKDTDQHLKYQVIS